MDPNPHKGEVSVTLAGKAYIMRPSYATIVKMEHALGQKLIPFMKRMERQDIGIEDVAIILSVGINANADNNAKLTRDAVGECVFNEGFSNFVKPMSEFLQAIVNAGAKNAPTQEGDEDAKKPTEGQETSTGLSS